VALVGTASDSRFAESLKRFSRCELLVLHFAQALKSHSGKRMAGGATVRNRLVTTAGHEFLDFDFSILADSVPLERLIATSALE